MSPTQIHYFTSWFSKCKSTSSQTTDSPAKRKNHDSDESGRTIAIASEKAKTITSKEVHDSTWDEAHPKLQDDDALSLCGDYGLVNEPLEPEDELNNDGLLTQITTFLSSSNESGLSISDKLSKLVNAKFQTQYSGDKRKEILQKYKTPSNCTQLFAPKVNPEIWGNLSRYQNVCVTGHVNQSVQCHCGNRRGLAESLGEEDLSQL